MLNFVMCCLQTGVEFSVRGVTRRQHVQFYSFSSLFLHHATTCIIIFRCGECEIYQVNIYFRRQDLIRKITAAFPHNLVPPPSPSPPILSGVFVKAHPRNVKETFHNLCQILVIVTQSAAFNACSYKHRSEKQQN